MGTEYELVNGAEIPNLGEGMLDAVSVNAPETPKRSHVQVDVHKCLLSVTGSSDMGYVCVLKKDGRYLSDESRGENISMERKGNLYDFQMMVRGAKVDEHPSQDFVRQG